MSDRLLPDGLRAAGIEAILRARLALAFSAVVFVAALAFSIAVIARAGIGCPMLVVTLGATVAAGSLPLLLRATGRLGLVGNSIAAMAVVPLTITSLQTGGSGMPGLFLLSVAPLIALLLAGRRSAIAWMLVCVAEILLLAGLRRAGQEFPLVPDAATREFAQTVGATILVLAVLGIALCYESLKSRAFLALAAANRDLEEARDRALEGARAKAAFLATMSHEIRTPMNGVIGMANLLFDTSLDEEQRGYVEGIRTSGNSLLTILNDILDYSKIEAGRIDLEHCRFELRPCLEEALDLFAAKAAAQGVELMLDIAPGVPRRVTGDPTRLRQILVNLLSNAVKFTEAGEVLLAVEADGIVDGRLELHFAVRDTGIGISAEQMEGLFDSFRQADASMTRRYGGTGLGLAISRRLAEIMDGRMWVESVAGAGSTFHFCVVVETAEEAAEDAAGDALADSIFAGRRVLLVDDNHANLRLLASQVERLGMAATSLAAPRGAVDLVANGARFDVAILDMMMPVLDGLGLAAELRQLAAAKHLPILILSSAPASDVARQAALRGIDLGALVGAVLTKPIKAAALRSALSRVLGGECLVPGRRPPAAAEVDGVLASRLPLRILLAEDNPVNQMVASRLLARMGYRPEIAGNGLEAIRALTRTRFDVVLMDVQMPELDGLEATRQIRERFPDADLWVIGLTAGALPEDRARCLAAGMDDYLAKPFRPAELEAKLRARAFRGRGATQPHDTDHERAISM